MLKDGVTQDFNAKNKPGNKPAAADVVDVNDPEAVKNSFKEFGL